MRAPSLIVSDMPVPATVKDLRPLFDFLQLERVDGSPVAVDAEPREVARLLMAACAYGAEIGARAASRSLIDLVQATGNYGAGSLPYGPDLDWPGDGPHVRCPNSALPEIAVALDCSPAPDAAQVVGWTSETAGNSIRNDHASTPSGTEQAAGLPAHRAGTSKQDARPGLVVVLFTDIQDSTALTHRLGDARAQELVRAHNSLVRNALACHEGSEIKHTGDGIMAVFGSACAALECATAIQRAVSVASDRDLRVHIGLNAGEPVAEESDLFGTAVQLARRVCDRAVGGQVFASDVVRQLAAGKGFSFEDRGAAPLKGFPEPVPTFELIWQEPASPDSLTPGELEVLRLVNAGRTNAEIASELDVSVQTVARHIISIYTKSGDETTWKQRNTPPSRA